MTKNSKVNIYGRVCWKLALLLASIVLGVSAAKAETMLMEQGRNSYDGTVTGIRGTLGASAAWSGTTFYRAGYSASTGYDTTTLWRFNDSAGLGIGTIMSSPTQQVTINSAELRLTPGQTSNVNYTSTTFYVAPLLETWSQINPSTGNLDVPSYDASKAVSIVINSYTSGTQISINVSSIVQSWVNGDYDNYGFALYTLDTTGESSITQIHNEYRANLGQRPQLFIDYTISAVPEPTVWVLMLSGALVLVGTGWYRRRAHC